MTAYDLDAFRDGAKLVVGQWHYSHRNRTKAATKVKPSYGDRYDRGIRTVVFYSAADKKFWSALQTTKFDYWEWRTSSLSPTPVHASQHRYEIVYTGTDLHALTEQVNELLVRKLRGDTTYSDRNTPGMIYVADVETAIKDQIAFLSSY